MPNLDIPDVVRVGETYWLGSERVLVTDIWTTLSLPERCYPDDTADVQHKALPRSRYSGKGLSAHIYCKPAGLLSGPTIDCRPRELRMSCPESASTYEPQLS